MILNDSPPEPPVLVWLNDSLGITLEQRCEDGSVSSICVGGNDVALLIEDLRNRLKRLREEQKEATP